MFSWRVLDYLVVAIYVLLTAGLALDFNCRGQRVTHARNVQKQLV